MNKENDLEKRKWLSVAEAAEYIGCSQQMIYNGVAKNARHPFPIKPRRFGRRVLLSRPEIDAYLERQ